MIPFGTIAASVAVITAMSACRSGELGEAEALELASRENRTAARLAAAEDSTGDAVLARWVLPPDLREISGIALTADGRLLAHNDQQGKVFVIDPRRGVIVKQFTIGRNIIRADFEGIAVDREEIYMLVSNGTIYRFREGENDERVAHTVIDTRLGKECEFEGIAVDRVSGLLLLPCKVVGKKSMRDQLVIYRWDPRLGGKQRPSVVTIPLARVIGDNDWKGLRISDITVDPVTRNYVLIAGPEKAIVVISQGWDVVSARPLPGVNEQAEGVAITNDGILIISNEGRTGPGVITLYRWPLAPASAGDGSPPAAEHEPR